MENLHLFTKAELELKVLKHQEGRVTLPARMLKEVKAEMRRRKELFADDEPTKK